MSVWKAVLVWFYVNWPRGRPHQAETCIHSSLWLYFLLPRLFFPQQQSSNFLVFAPQLTNKFSILYYHIKQFGCCLHSTSKPLNLNHFIIIANFKRKKKNNFPSLEWRGHAVDNIFPSADASDHDHEKQLHHRGGVSNIADKNNNFWRWNPPLLTDPGRMALWCW